MIPARSPIPLSRNKKRKIPDTPGKKLPDDIVGNLFCLLTIGWQTRGPQRQYTIRRSFFPMRHLLACSLDLVGPHSQSLSRFLLFVEHVDNGIRRRHGERTRTGKNRSGGRRLHSFEHTALAQWLQPSHPKLYCPGSIPTSVVEKYLTLSKISSLVYPVFRTLNIVLPFWK